jgi:hypothetical protein
MAAAGLLEEADPGTGVAVTAPRAFPPDDPLQVFYSND